MLGWDDARKPARSTTSDRGYSGYTMRRSRAGLTGTIAVHALVVGAFLLIPKEAIRIAFDPPPLLTKNIPIKAPPPPEPTDPPMADAKAPTTPTVLRPTSVDPVVPMTWDTELTGSDTPGTAVDPGPTIILPPADPPRQPVLTDPVIDPRAQAGFQPDYPGTMIRQGVEGSVTVRVTIGPDGRVTAIEKMSASDESFWQATQRHAMKKWRFRPATRDGVPVASTKVLTVRFTLTG